MKKLLAMLLILVALIGGAVTVHGASIAPARTCPQNDCYVDNHNDNPCDNRTDCVAQGTCPRMNGQECYADTDDNGICDNRADCPMMGGNGCGAQMRGCGMRMMQNCPCGR